MTGSEHLQNCSSCGPKWSKEGEVVSRRQGHIGQPLLTDTRWEWRLARVFPSNGQATVAQTAEEFNAGSDKKKKRCLEYTVHGS